MTVAELIELLSGHPPEMQIIWPERGEYLLLTPDDITVEKHCPPREDGWVPPLVRPYRNEQEYLVLPGN